jgi:hypothetical protein
MPTSIPQRSIASENLPTATRRKRRGGTPFQQVRSVNGCAHREVLEHLMSIAHTALVMETDRRSCT